VQDLQWTSDDFVFVPELDAAHQKIFRDAEKVRRALEALTPASSVGFHVWRLSKTFAAHLASEERAMRCSQYAALQWHQLQHHAGRAKMARLLEAAHRKDEESGRSALQEFMRWLRDHVSLADRMFAAHLRNDRRESLVS